MDQIYLKELTKFLKTKQRAYKFLEKIDELTRQVNTSSYHTYIQRHFTSEELEYIPIHSFAIRQELSQLVDQIKNVSILEIFTAVEPSFSCEQTLVQKLQNSLNEAILINVRLQPSLIAGAVIQYQGKLYDGSLKDKLRKLQV